MSLSKRKIYICANMKMKVSKKSAIGEYYISYKASK